MKIIVLEKDKLIKNFKRNWKKALVIMVIFIVVGIISGICSAKTYEYQKKTYKNDTVKAVQLTTSVEDSSFYISSLYTFRNKKEQIKAYLEYFSKMDLKEENRAILQQIDEKMDLFEKDYEKEEDLFFLTPAAYNGNADAYIKLYLDRVDILEEDSALLDLDLEKVLEGKYDKDYKEKKQSDINNQKNLLESEKTRLLCLVDYIKSTEEDELIRNDCFVRTLISSNADKLNVIINEFNIALKTISQSEQYEIVFNEYLLDSYFDEKNLDESLEESEKSNNVKDKALIYAKSVEGIDVSVERCLAVITFFALTGLIIASLFSLLFEKKEKNNEDIYASVI